MALSKNKLANDRTTGAFEFNHVGKSQEIWHVQLNEMLKKYRKESSFTEVYSTLKAGIWRNTLISFKKK